MKQSAGRTYGATGSGASVIDDAHFAGANPDTVTLMLGLQGTSGRVEFDLSTLHGAPTHGLWRRINRDYIVRYPENRAGPLRGCMLPGRATMEDDIEALHRWGATMARFQITRNWSKVDDNQDLDEFTAWVDSRLDNLEDVLRWAGARGMKICVDLHVTPGGRGAEAGHERGLVDVAHPAQEDAPRGATASRSCRGCRRTARPRSRSELAPYLEVLSHYPLIVSTIPIPGLASVRVLGEGTEGTIATSAALAAMRKAFSAEIQAMGIRK